MAKYKINSVRLSKYGQVGDIVELENINNIPYCTFLEKVDEVKDEEVIAESEEARDKRKLYDELVNKAGFSRKRAEKIIGVYKSRKDLLSEDIDKLPFEQVEIDALKAYYIKSSVEKFDTSEANVEPKNNIEPVKVGKVKKFKRKVE